MFGPVGLPELLVIGCVLAVLFGVNKLPKLGKNLGLGIKEFRNAGKELLGENEDDDD